MDFGPALCYWLRKAAGASLMNKHSLFLPILVVVFAVSAWAQAAVEYGLGVGRAGVTGAATGKKAGDAIGSVFNKTAAAAEKAGSAGTSAAAKPNMVPKDKLDAQKTAVAAAQPPAAAPAEAKPAAAPAIDPSLITVGLTKQELLEKVGKPSMKLTNMDGGDVVEKYWYKASGHETVVVSVRNGKVAQVSPPIPQ